MKDLFKAGVISLAFVLPSSVNANSFGHEDDLEKTKIELSDALSYQDGKEIVGSYITPKIITKAVFDYFDEEVKLYKLSQKAREKIEPILDSYLSVHPLLVIGDEGRMSFVIDDMGEFCRVVKLLVNIILDDMPFLVRKVGVPLVFGGNDKLQEKLDDLGNTVYNMKKKSYKDVIFDYIGGIVKRVVKSVNGKMKIGQYYLDVSRCFPNKNFIKDSKSEDKGNSESNDITSGNWNKDIKHMEYPFKK